MSFGFLAPSVLRLWRDDPGAVAAEDHADACLAGFVNADADNAVTPCPVCAHTRKMARVNRELELSGIGQRYLSLEWADLELPEPLPRLKAACERIGEIVGAGHSLVLHGPPGGGKTQAAVVIVKAAIRAGYSARIGNLGRLALEVRDGYDGGPVSEAGVVHDLSHADVLVLDDLGAGETARAEVERRVLYLVLEARQNAAKPTIVTTNLGQTELAATVGARIMNRLQPMAVVNVAHGTNFRLRGAEKVLW